MNSSKFEFSEAANKESWQSLHEFYQSKYGVNSHYRYRYIVDRLVDTEIATQYMIGETWVFTDPDRPKPSNEKSLDDLHVDHHRIQNSPNGYGRGLFFTKGPFGIDFSTEPFVCVFVNIDGTELMAQYCRGYEIIEAHLCQPRKEIPCLISLLRNLDESTE